MSVKFFYAFLLLLICVFKENNACNKLWFGNPECGVDCGGRPKCGGDKRCGNVDGMCWCQCVYLSYKCLTTPDGYKWNSGIRKSNGDYALNGTIGDGKHYRC